ncbi:hypothetical protein M0R45_018633 [Rubus argutus]|uniref:GATA-type domain-containing protein n=1 Tax=Rubus argutus TaxID=59490 RepID=A0AAW1X4S4_RUBAR
MSSCRTREPTHQALKEFLVQQQLFCNQANNETNEENTAEVEIKGKCQNCGAEQSQQWFGGPLGPKTLCVACGLAKCTAKRQRYIAVEVGKLCCPLPAAGEFSNSTLTFPALEEFFPSQKPSNIAIAEHQKPFSVLANSANNSTTLMSSCRIKTPHRARSKGLRRRRSAIIPRQQVGIESNCWHCRKQTQRWWMGPLGPTTLCNACGNRYEPLWGRSGVTVDIAKKCQHCGSEETTQWLSCPLGPKALCNACYHWFRSGRRQFCNQTNNNPDKKASAKVEIRRKCQHCEAEVTPVWRPGPLGSNTLCNACGIRWFKFGDLCRVYRPASKPVYRPASKPTFSMELRSNCYRKVTGMKKQDIGVEMVVEPMEQKNTIGN